MKTIKNRDEMDINHLINAINYFFYKDMGRTKEYWIELLYRLEKISWDEELIKMYNKPFYEKYIKTGLLKKSFEYNNGVPIIWEGEI